MQPELAKLTKMLVPLVSVGITWVVKGLTDLGVQVELLEAAMTTEFASALSGVLLAVTYGVWRIPMKPSTPPTADPAPVATPNP